MRAAQERTEPITLLCGDRRASRSCRGEKSFIHMGSSPCYNVG